MKFYKGKTLKYFNEINIILKNKTTMNLSDNKFFEIKNNIDFSFKILWILIKAFLNIFKWIFLIWILCGILFFILITINYDINSVELTHLMKLNSYLFKTTNYSQKILGSGTIIDWILENKDNIDLISSVLSIFANFATILEIIHNVTNDGLEYVVKLNTYWSVFVYPISLLSDSIYLILIGMTGIPLVNSIIFGFSNQNTLWGLPSFYWYGFLISFIIIVFLIFYQLLSIASKKNNEKQRVNKTKSLFLGVILIFSSIIFIPLLFVIIDSLIIFMTNIILSTMDISTKTFSFSNILFQLSFSDPTISNNIIISSIPSEPIFLGINLTSDIFYHIFFFVGLAIILFFEFKLLIFLFTRVFNIMFLLVANPIVNSFYIVDEGERFKAWLKKLINEFFIIVFIVLEFTIFIISYSVIQFAIADINTTNSSVIEYIIFMTFTITMFTVTLKSENILKTIFVRNVQKVEGKVMTKSSEDYQNVKLDKESLKSLKSISPSVKSSISSVNKNTIKMNNILKNSISSDKDIQNKIIRVNKKINQNLMDVKINNKIGGKND